MHFDTDHIDDMEHNGIRSQDAPFGAYRFETPGVSPDTVSKTRFEFVLVEDTYLETFGKTPDPDAFYENLSSPSCKNSGGHETDATPAGCVFPNLSGSATLAAPTDWSPPSSPSIYSSSYGHLANFVRGAPEQQVLQLWNVVGNTLMKKLILQAEQSSSSVFTWFSTAGTGVAWLHFRLDSRPKYYSYRPYKQFAR